MYPVLDPLCLDSILKLRSVVSNNLGQAVVLVDVPNRRRLIPDVAMLFRHGGSKFRHVSRPYGGGRLAGSACPVQYCRTGLGLGPRSSGMHGLVFFRTQAFPFPLICNFGMSSSVPRSGGPLSKLLQRCGQFVIAVKCNPGKKSVISEKGKKRV